MRLSRYFLPILKETPKEAEIVSHRLMLRAGMIRQQSAGIHVFKWYVAFVVDEGSEKEDEVD